MGTKRDKPTGRVDSMGRLIKESSDNRGEERAGVGASGDTFSAMNELSTGVTRYSYLSFDEEVDDLNDHARDIFGQADGLDGTNFTVQLSDSDQAEATDAFGDYPIQIDIDEDMSADEMMEHINEASQYVNGEIVDANKELGSNTVSDITLRLPTWAIEAVHDKHL